MARFRFRVGGRARFVPVALATAVLSSTILAASVTGTLSAFTASITNSTDTAASGSLVMKETDSTGSTTCLSTDNNSSNAATCSTINKYGGTGTPLTPGATNTAVAVKISNLGNTTVNGFTLAPGSCSTSTTNSSLASSNGNLCSKLLLTLTCQSSAPQSTSTTLISGVALSALSASYNIRTLASSCVPAHDSGTVTTFTFQLQMDPGADATVQNQTASQQLAWTFTGA